MKYMTEFEIKLIRTLRKTLLHWKYEADMHTGIKDVHLTDYNNAVELVGNIKIKQDKNK